MEIIVIIAIIIIAVIAVKVKKAKAYDEEYDEEYKELKETIHNSGIIKELSEQLKALVIYNDFDWLYKQVDYYDECERNIVVFDSIIGFNMWKDDDWQPMFSIRFVEDLGYKPLLDNGLSDGKKHIKNKDIYTIFANEVCEIVKNLFNNEEINFNNVKYSSGYESQQQSDGSYKSVKIGDENASIRYKVPKSVTAKQI